MYSETYIENARIESYENALGDIERLLRSLKEHFCLKREYIFVENGVCIKCIPKVTENYYIIIRACELDSEDFTKNVYEIKLYDSDTHKEIDNGKFAREKLFTTEEVEEHLENFI